MTTKRILIEKLKNGGQITLEDIESLGSKKRKDPEERPAKVCSPKHAIAKFKKGVKLNRWELEELAKSPEHAVEYAKLTGSRFPECEESLVTKGNFRIITEYFFYIAKEKSALLEKWLIEEGQSFVSRYCSEILGSRWKEGEDALLKINERWRNSLNLDSALAYHKEFSVGHWDELEKILLNGKVKVGDRRGSISCYFRNCGPGRHEATEQRLLKYGNTGAIFLYAKFRVCGRLPDELHNKMVLSGRKGAKKYLSWLSVKKKNTLAYLRSLGEEERKELFPETAGRTG